MSRSLRLFICSMLSIFGCTMLPPPTHAVTNSSNALQVESFQVAPVPQSCNATLSVRVRNNGSTATDSALFLHADQYRSLGGTLRRSSFLGGQRVPVLAPGQTTDLSFTFVREPDKTHIWFTFKIGPGTLATADGALPAFSASYAGIIASHRLDRAANQLQGTIRNTGTYPIPHPIVLPSVARQSSTLTHRSASSSFVPVGSGIVMSQCLLPGVTASFTQPVTDAATIAAYKLRLVAGVNTLDEKLSGQAPVRSSVPIRQKPRMDTKPILRPRQ